MLGAAVEALAALLAARTGHAVGLGESAPGEGVRLRLDVDGLSPEPVPRLQPSTDPGRPPESLLPCVIRLRLTAEDGGTLPARLEALEAAANALAAAPLAGQGWQGQALIDTPPDGASGPALHIGLRVMAR